MSKNRYNTVLFVAALSVSMGLFLMSAPPHVFAEAALAGKFEIKDQIEKNDNLDKDDEEIKSLTEFYGNSAERLNAARSETNFEIQKSQSYQLDFGFEKSLSRIESANKKDLTEKTKHFFDNVNSATKICALDKDIVENVLLENLSVSSENNQVLIVTRLPRGSLADLDAEGKSTK